VGKINREEFKNFFFLYYKNRKRVKMAYIEDIDDIIAEVSPYYKKRKEAAEKKTGAVEQIASQEHKLTYNSPAETLEPVYFWILDFMQGFFGGNVEKIYDNFTSTPGSGHFGELQQRATIMQQQASKIMGDVNNIIKSILNLIYSLKEFQMRLSHYDQANSKDKDEAEAGLLALKQIWLDNVDIKRGNTSIKALALSGQAPFVTLIDAFMAAKSVKDVEKMDLNDRVKRLLKPRVAEFFEWKKRSEKELRKRYEIEKTYLKSQVASLKLYTKWAKPYLKAASDLMQKEQTKNPDLVNIFNTVVLGLTLMGKKKIDFKQAVLDDDLPEPFEKVKLKRNYYSVVVVDLMFRGIPQRIQQGQSGHYAFGGKVDVRFRAYALNEDEIKLLDKKLEENELQESFKLIELMTSQSLEQLEEDIAHFLKEEEEEEKKEKEDENPFLALLGAYKEKKKEKKEEDDIKELEEKGVKKDNWIERYARALAEAGARQSCYTIYDVYKKAHGMASHPGLEFEGKFPKGEFKEIFG